MIYRKYLFYVLGHNLGDVYPINKYNCVVYCVGFECCGVCLKYTDYWRTKKRMIYIAFLLNLSPFSATYTPNNINIEPRIAIVVICSLITMAEVSKVTNGTK